MNAENYLVESARTVSDQWHDDDQETIEWNVNAICMVMEPIINQLDDMKKLLFYGRQPKTYTVTLKGQLPVLPEIGYQRVFHSLIGVMTEAGEVMKLLTEMIKTGESPPATSIADEFGDLLWYMALGLRETDQTFEGLMHQNIEKLKIRYPDKFTSQAAIERDPAKETAVFNL